MSNESQADNDVHARRLKHLEMLQTIIARLAQNSFTIKAWSTTISSALLALAAKGSDQSFAILAIVPAFVFWFLDAHYLLLERRYRVLYEEAARRLDPTMSLSLEPPMVNSKLTWASAFLARTVAPVYAVAVVVALFIVMRLAWVQ